MVPQVGKVVGVFRGESFRCSLLEHRSPVSAAGVVPSVHDVIRDGLHVR